MIAIGSVIDELFVRSRLELLDRTSAFDPSRFFLYGAGTMGRAALAALRARGANPLGFIDDTPGKHGTSIDGLEVFAECPLPGASVVVCVHNPRHDYAASRRRFGNGTLSFMHLPWLFPGVELAHASHPDHYRARRDDLVTLYGCLADQVSRDTLAEQIRFRLILDWQFTQHSAAAYFPPDIGLPFGEAVNFIDAGAYDGDTARAFLRHFPRPGKIIAIEADPDNFRALQAGLRSLGVAHVAHNAAVGGEEGMLRFDASGNMAARLSPDGQLLVPCHTLEYFMEGVGDPCYVKFDVEGAESEIIEQSAALLAKRKPVLAVSIYHRPMDIIDIPLRLHRLGYRLSMRYHGIDGADLVLYALPI